MKTFERVITLLEKELEKAGGSVNAIVKKTKLTHNTITAYLEGRAEPSQASLEKLGKAYGYSVSWLRGDKEEPPLRPGLVDISGFSPVKKQLWEVIRALPEDKAKNLLLLLKS